MRRSITSTNIAFQATAVLMGSFLAGAMMSISFIAIPVLVDTNHDPGHLGQQWARLYGYGIQIMPAGAIATTLLYFYVIITKVRSSQPWHSYAYAVVVTMNIVPFTWYVMAPTNNLLFRLNGLEERARVIAEVHELITKWRWLHMIRSLFPLVGATIGLTSTLDEVLV